MATISETILELVQQAGESGQDPIQVVLDYMLEKDSRITHIEAGRLVEQARQTLKALKPIFTPDQQKAMASIQPPSRNGRQGFGARPGGRPGQGGPLPGGPPPGGMQGRVPGGRPGGPRPGGQMSMNSAAMANFNPFYVGPKAKDGMAAGRAKHWDAFFARLDKESRPARHGKAASKR